MANPPVGGGQGVADPPVDSESDDEEVVETSPCGRWEKHKKEVCVYTLVTNLNINVPFMKF